MTSPTDVDSPPAVASVLVNLFHQSDRISGSDMTARTATDHRGVPGATSVIRLVPLVRSFSVHGQQHLATGSVRVVVSGELAVAFEVFVQGIWARQNQTSLFTPLDATADDEADQWSTASRALELELAHPLQATDSGEIELEYLAAELAKGLAEESRNAAADLREIRYALELELAETSTRASTHGSQASVVSALLQLGIICGRAADSAREAVREGLWVHLTDPAAYHAHRVLLNPAIVTHLAPATVLTRPWMRLHDAAIRQCIELGTQLNAESVAVHALLAAAASVSSSREADAQTSFNTLAAVASLGLGIPALVLALYGADRLLPLDTLPRQVAFLPVAAGLVFATVLAMRRSPRGEHRRVWIVGAAAALTALLGLLVIAGVLAPS
jgi:hypothetical protein